MSKTKRQASAKMFDGPKEKGLFEINAMALEKERNGEKIIHMEIGRPDFDTPASVKAAAIKALENGAVFYTNLRGTDELRLAAASYLRRQLGLEYKPFEEILVTVGASEALHDIWSAFFDPGDEIIVPSPYYGSYREMIRFAGGEMVEVPIIENGRVVYDMNKFEAALTPKTKMIILNSPNNPTGYVMTREEIIKIAEFAEKNDLIVISDECYDHYVFEGEYVSIAQLPGMKERTLIVHSTSKLFSMTGWRVGFIAGPQELVQHCITVHGHEVVCPAAFAQAGAAYAYANEMPEVVEMCAEFQRRKEYIAEFLQSYGKLGYIEPKGAFYVFIDISATGLSGADFCEQFLLATGVTFSPGTVFGSQWKDYIRVSYASSMDNIREAMTSLKAFCDKMIK